MKRILALVLIVCMSFELIGNDCTISANSELAIKTVYVDGREYHYYIDKEGRFHLEDSDNEAELILNSNGEADVTLGGDEEVYSIDFETLTSSDIEATVYNEDGEVVEEYNDIDDVVEDNYEGQFFIAIPAIVIELLVEVLVCLAATVVVNGVLRYAASVIVKEVSEKKRKQGLIYKAYLHSSEPESVYVDVNNTIDATQAKSRIMSGKNIYTYSGTLARQIVISTKLGATLGEITKKSNMKKGYVYYYHYHTANRNGAHAWYGKPYTK